MVDYKDYANQITPAWCPGCGNWAIRTAVPRALAQAGLAPHEVLIVSGIGQASKLPDYLHVNSLTTLHGRPIAVAQGAHLANHDLKVIVHAGDGDTFGLGGNHYIHMMRRNADVTVMVHNNLIYGLTKGQYSPTSPYGFQTKTSPPPSGALERPVNPLALALTMEATFVARTFAGDPRHMIEMMVAAIRHRGAAVLDILQPCVVFNPQYSFDYFRPRVYRLDAEDYEPTDRAAAWQRAWEWGDRIPVGILYEERRPTYEELVPVLQEGGPLARRPFHHWSEADYREVEQEYL
jgi:2-oxoglutarate ferredoxin oxidoreductase subunit beta